MHIDIFFCHFAIFISIMLSLFGSPFAVAYEAALLLTRPGAIMVEIESTLHSYSGSIFAKISAASTSVYVFGVANGLLNRLCVIEINIAKMTEK